MCAALSDGIFDPAGHADNVVSRHRERAVMPRSASRPMTPPARLPALLLTLGLLLLSADSGAAARAAGGHDVVAPEPSPPVWPESYKVEFTVAMPQVYLMQPEEFVIPVAAWYDGPAGLSKVTLFGGVDMVLVDGEGEWDVHPRIDREKCYAFPARGDGAAPPLPDLRGWRYGGRANLDGQPAHSWRLQVKGGIDQVNDYRMFTAVSDGSPLRLNMFGRNLMEDSHFDEYIYRFTSFAPFESGTNGKAFRRPELCADAEPARADAVPGSLGAQLSAMLPSARVRGVAGGGGGGAYAHWWAAHGAAPAADSAELGARAARFAASAARVAAHNANPERSYTMQLGR